MTVYPFDDAKLAHYRERARRLGEMLADKDITRDDAQLTLGFVIEEAHRTNPTLDKSGLRARLVWDMRDHANALHLARIRERRRQEQTLTQIAERGFNAGASIEDIKRAIAKEASRHTPAPTIDMLEAALSLGKWRAKWTTT